MLDRIRQGLIRFLDTRSLENPKTPLSNPDAWLFTALGASPTFSGVSINERTALQSTGVDAAVRVIAGGIGSLPCHVFEYLQTRGRRKALQRREYNLLHNSPNPRMTSCVFREVVTTHALLSGNGYARIELDGSLKVKAIWPLMPNLVRPELTADRDLVYVVTDGITKEEIPYPASQIIHIPDLSMDGVTGLSRIRLHREGIGLGQALEAFGAEYFGNGTALSGVLESKKKLGDAALERLKLDWANKYGAPGKRHKVAVLEEEMQFKPIQQQADQAQFIQTRAFQLNEEARMFGVKPHKIGDLTHATFSNIEHQSQEHIEDTLRPWVVRWEQELTRKLFPSGEFFVELNLDGLLRADFQTRMAGYAQGRQWGWLSVNDIREKENMNPLPGEDGDQYLVPLNMTTPELLANPPKPAPAPQPATPEPEPPANRSKQEIKRYLRPMFADAIRRSLNYESKDPAKLERFVIRAFTPILLSMAEIAGTDRDVALSYAETIHTRLEAWTNEVKRENEPAPIVERELELAFNFIAAKESAA